MIAYSGDTEWTPALVEASAGADAFVCEGYFFDKRVPYHLDYMTLEEHRSELSCTRLIITHMSQDMLDHAGDKCGEERHRTWVAPRVLPRGADYIERSPVVHKGFQFEPIRNRHQPLTRGAGHSTRLGRNGRPPHPARCAAAPAAGDACVEAPGRRAPLRGRNRHDAAA